MYLILTKQIEVLVKCRSTTDIQHRQNSDTGGLAFALQILQLKKFRFSTRNKQKPPKIAIKAIRKIQGFYGFKKKQGFSCKPGNLDNKYKDFAIPSTYTMLIVTEKGSTL